MQMPAQTTQMPMTAPWAPMQQGSEGVLELQVRDAALDRLRMSAQAGDAEAQFVLGQRYEAEKDEALDRNVRRANMWYAKAASQGHRGAQSAVERLRYEVFCKTWCGVPQVRGECRGVLFKG